MFCKKCGAQLNDNAKFCAKCGAQFGNEAAAPVAQPVQVAQPVAPAADPFAQPAAPVADPFAQPAQPAQPTVDPYAAPVQMAQNWGPTMKAKKSGKGAKIAIISSIVGLVAVIALVIVLLFACGGGGASSIEEALDEFFVAVSEKDLDAVSDIMYPAVFEDSYDPEIYEEEEFMEDMLDELNPGDGKPKFGSIKIEKKEKYSTDKIENMNDALEDNEEYIKIESGVSVTGKITIKVDGESHTYRLSATLVKADGDWYVTGVSVGKYAIDEDEE